MDRVLIERLVRNFHENGLKVLLEQPANVRDTLEILRVGCVRRIVFEEMRVDPAQFVQADYRHLASDLVLRAPLRAGRGRKRMLTIYILFEHQSEPDELMAFRVLEYLLQICKRHLREWEQEHGSRDGFRFPPVLPIVLCTGTRTWNRLLKLSEVMEQDEDLSGLAPEFAPLFLNVGQTAGAELEERGGAFGLLLRLVQQRRVRRSLFEALLRRVVRALEDQLAEDDRNRWLSLLSYVAALIYHEREKPEQDELRRVVVDSVQNDVRRVEVRDMGQTIAEALKEEGRVEGAVQSLRNALLRLLRLKFRKIPPGIERRIENTEDVDQLNAWLDALMTARRLPSLGIPPLE